MHTVKLQKAIVSQKGCVTEMNGAGKAQKASVLFKGRFSRLLLALCFKRKAYTRFKQALATQLYQWSQDTQSPVKQQASDFEDVSDRLAWMTFKQGEIMQAYATKLESARAALKDIRNFEQKLVVQRDSRQEIKQRIKKLIEKRSEEAKIQAAEEELAHLESQHRDAEMSVLALKRQKLKECYTLEFEGMRQMGEELSVLASHGELLLDCLSSPQDGHAPGPYTDFQRTLQIRDECDRALSSYDKQHPLIPKPQLSQPASELARSNSTVSSFAHTHKGDIAALTHGGPASPAASATTYDPFADDPVSHLNTAPTASVVPSSSPMASPLSAPPPTSLQPGAPLSPHASRTSDTAVGSTQAPLDPTIAETGIPISGSNGPAEGQLKPRRPSAAGSTTLPPPVGSVGSPPVVTEAAVSKEQEWRDEVERNWQAAHGEGSNLNRASTSATGPPAYSLQDEQQGSSVPPEKGH